MTDQAIRVLETIAKHSNLPLQLTSVPFGGAAIDAAGDPLPEDTLNKCKEADAILLGEPTRLGRDSSHLTVCLGAVGGPKWGVGPVRPEQGILRLRKELGLYANIRPSNFISESLLQHSPLKEDRARGVNIIVLRELIGGLCEW